MAAPLSIDMLVVAAGTVMAGVIAKLWASIVKNHEQAVEESKEQKTINREMNTKVIELSEKVGHSTGYKDGVDDLANALISEIRENDGRPKVN